MYKNSNESLILTNQIYNLAFYINQPNCTYIKQDPNANAFEGEKLPKIIKMSNNVNNSFNDFEDYLRYKKSNSILENNFKTI